ATPGRSRVSRTDRGLTRIKAAGVDGPYGRRPHDGGSAMAGRRFAPLRYLCLVLLVAPFVMVALAWGAVVIRARTKSPVIGQLNDASTNWLVVALAAGVVCFLCEWMVLPFVLADRKPRPTYTPLISLAIGLALAATAYLVLRDWL